MCGIAGIVSLTGASVPSLQRRLDITNEIQKHRGPDGCGTWLHPSNLVGFAHRRLSIIDLSTGRQPMTDGEGNWITFNGEIYNYIELRNEIGASKFKTTSDTEVILQAYRKWGDDCVSHLRGMFAFAIWDEAKQRVFAARDRFGIKPFCYTTIGDAFYFASEPKALMPFLPRIETDLEAFREYLGFQFCLAGKTLFKGVRELLPGHSLVIERGVVRITRYWEVYYNLDFEHTSRYFQERIRHLFEDAVNSHLRSDVPVGAYLSGGLDSSIVAAIAARKYGKPFVGFHGRFTHGPEYDESQHARAVADDNRFDLQVVDIVASDFTDNIRKVIYHLDYPLAGPGSFPQYLVSKLAARHLKVVLGGQGGDEVFGGYVRYLIAYFEQCIKGAIDGTMKSGNFIVTYESIIPNLVTLRQYKPMLKEFWREGLFEDIDRRYFRLIDRSGSLDNEIRWEAIGEHNTFETFKSIFHANNVSKESYFDSMTHFDFKTLLPALLHVEDRVSMAHGLESRVPILDHPLVECAATIPADIKFKDGDLKHLLKHSLGGVLPESVLNRKDKMGFPVPLSEWMQKDVRDFVCDIFASSRARERDLVDNATVLKKMSTESKFGRKIWGFLCLELWQQEFHDQHARFKNMMANAAAPEPSPA